MDDERLAKIEQERQNALTQSNNAYEQMLQNNQNMYDQNMNMANTYETTQNDILDKQLAYNTNLINQQKETAQKNYETESKKARNDYQSYINPYGYQAESMASQGLLNSGVSETAKLGGYNTYQNRLATANKTLQDAFVQYDNEMAQARLNNDVQKAQNALNKLQMQTEFATNYYNNQNTYAQNQLTNNQNLSNDYFNRYQTEYSNIQNEKARQEAIRQYNEQLAYQKARDAVADSQWEKEYALSKQNSAINSAYYKSLTDNSSQTDALGNSATIQAKDDYYFNGTDQPRYINNNKLTTNGITAGDIGITGDGIGSGYRIWTANGKYYVWNNNAKTYREVTDYYNQAINAGKKSVKPQEKTQVNIKPGAVSTNPYANNAISDYASRYIR